MDLTGNRHIIAELADLVFTSQVIQLTECIFFEFFFRGPERS